MKGNPMKYRIQNLTTHPNSNRRRQEASERKEREPVRLRIHATATCEYCQTTKTVVQPLTRDIPSAEAFALSQYEKSGWTINPGGINVCKECNRDDAGISEGDVLATSPGAIDQIDDAYGDDF